MCKTERFINRAREVHGEKWNYDNVNYTHCHSKVEIICPKHGHFMQSANNHLLGCGCKKCGIEVSNKKQNKTFNHKERITKVHGDKYEYNLPSYLSMRTKIEIICKEHGPFLQTLGVHLRGHGCPKCAGFQNHNATGFLRKAKKKHGNRYTYPNLEYVNCKTKIEIECKEHGPFWQTPQSHVQGFGCPKCKASKGEIKIGKYLAKKGFKFVEQKAFKGCRYKNLLRFDFYIPSLNCVIEYNGKQHYEPVEIFGGKKGFELQQQRDTTKLDFCKKNGIEVIYIKYSSFNEIEEILNNKLWKKK